MCRENDNWLPTATFIFLIAVILVELLLDVAGASVTLYAMIAAFSILPALYKSRVRRIWAVVATFFVLTLLIWDHQAGIRLQQRLFRLLRACLLIRFLNKSMGGRGSRRAGTSETTGVSGSAGASPSQLEDWL